MFIILSGFAFEEMGRIPSEIKFKMHVYIWSVGKPVASGEFILP